MEQPTSHQSAELDGLTAELGELRAELRSLGSRVARLEQRTDVVAPGGIAAQPLPAAARPTPAPTALAAALPAELTHIGRLLLVLAGAFLLRSATEGGQLPRTLGVALGFVYALSWVAAEWRAGRRGDRVGAAFHAVTTLVIAYPLLWEATVRFHVVGAVGSALLLAGTTALLLHAAWRQRTAAIAWLAAAAAAATAAVLAVGTRQPAPFAALLVGLAGGGIVVGEARGWRPLAWATAIVGDLAVAVLTLGALVPRAPLAPLEVLPVQLSLVVLYLGAAAVLARRRRPLGWPLLLQAAAATALGWGGALVVARAASPPLALGVGVLGLLLAGGVEATALRLLPSGAMAARLTLLFAAAALGAGGVALMMPFSTVAWAAIAVAAIVWGARAGLAEVELQGAAVAAAAMLGTGAIGAAGAALLLPAEAPLPWSLPALSALLAVTVGLVVLWLAGGARSRLGDAAVMVLLALLAWVGAGGAAAACTPLLGADAGMRAAAGTALLAIGAMVLARLGRESRFAAAVWLVYPLLAAIALKLLLVDLPHGRPLTLFLSLAALGAAVLTAARAARRPAAVST